MPNGSLRIIFHCAGEIATIKRIVEFDMPKDSGLWIASEPYPVVMQFSHVTTMRAPARQEPARLPQAIDHDEDIHNDQELSEWFVALREQRLREELGLNIQP